MNNDRYLRIVRDDERAPALQTPPNDRSPLVGPEAFLTDLLHEPDEEPHTRLGRFTARIGDFIERFTVVPPSEYERPDAMVVDPDPRPIDRIREGLGTLAAKVRGIQ